MQPRWGGGGRERVGTEMSSNRTGGGGGPPAEGPEGIGEGRRRVLSVCRRGELCAAGSRPVSVTVSDAATCVAATAERSSLQPLWGEGEGSSATGFNKHKTRFCRGRGVWPGRAG